MIGVGIERWCAWAPGLEGADAWRAWAEQPFVPPRSGGAPPIDFVPAMLRRRCDPLARMLLYVARGCFDADGELGDIPLVMASRHGPFAITAKLLEDIADAKPLSPTAFSHSVHNTALGLLSIWAGNRAASVAISARRDSFAHGFLEALALLQRSRAREVLFVTADEALPDVLEPIRDEWGGSYAVALRLRRTEGEPALALRLEAAAPPDDERGWPDALEFVRWWIGTAPELRIAHAPRIWTWQRGLAADRATPIAVGAA